MSVYEATVGSGIRERGCFFLLFFFFGRKNVLSFFFRF